MIAILKPFNACAQICVYCQRNWEIGGVADPKAMASPDSISKALDWFRSHPMVSEVLVTGGDPALMGDEVLVDLLRAIVGDRACQEDQDRHPVAGGPSHEVHR